MSRVVVIEPAEPAVTVEEAVTARVFSATDSEDFVGALLAVAQASLEGPNGWLGRSIGEQTLELRADRFCAQMRLPYPPLIAIDSVEYVDSAGMLRTLEPERYRAFGIEGPEPFVVPTFGGDWPSTRSEPEAVRIRYVAGYEDVPAPLKHAIMLLAGELKTHGVDLGRLRSTTVEGVGSRSYQVPADAEDAMRRAGERLLSGYRIFV